MPLRARRGPDLCRRKTLQAGEIRVPARRELRAAALAEGSAEVDHVGLGGQPVHVAADHSVAVGQRELQEVTTSVLATCLADGDGGLFDVLAGRARPEQDR